MSKGKKNVIEVDKIHYVHYKNRESGGIGSAFIDVSVDGKRHKLVVIPREEKTV